MEVLFIKIINAGGGTALREEKSNKMVSEYIEFNEPQRHSSADVQLRVISKSLKFRKDVWTADLSLAIISTYVETKVLGKV